MSTMSESRAETPSGATRTPAILVWDVPLRVFHWLMVLCFAGAFITAESERWRLVHVTLGYTMLGLVAFRMVWGLAGTRHARFANFVRGPAAVGRYVGALLRGQPEHHIGHNPAGAVAIVVLLALACIVGVSGWAIFNDLGGEWFEELHEGAANLMLAVVGIHVAGVIVSSWVHRENLMQAMVDGRKPGSPEQSAQGPRRLIAAVLLAAVLGFWTWQWFDAPTGTVDTPQAAHPLKQGHHEHD